MASLSCERQQNWLRVVTIVFRTIGIYVNTSTFTSAYGVQDTLCKADALVWISLHNVHCVPKKHVTTFSIITLTISVRLQ